MARFCIRLTGCLVLSLCSWAAAQPRPINALVPADCLVAYMAKPYAAADTPASRPATSGPDSEKLPEMSIASVAVFLSASGLIPDEGQVFADIAGALPLLGSFEHAVLLLDVSSRIVRPSTRPAGEDEEEQSLRLNDLQIAVIFRTEGRQKVVLDQINRLVTRYTNTTVGELQTVKVAGYVCQRLTDERLPGWALWEWGRLDDFYVLCFGEGAFEKIVRSYAGQSPRLSDDSWFKAASSRIAGDTAVAQWFIALSRIEDKLAQVAQRRFTRVIRALQADGMTHDLWTVGQTDRALTFYRCYRRNGEDVVRRYSDPQAYSPAHRKIVPGQARYYGVIHLPTRWLIDELPQAWLAAKSESYTRTWTKIWNRLQEETGIDIDDNLIEHLGDDVVLFDYPPHPLRIPFAITVAIEIDNRKAVQVALDALLAAWGRYLDEGTQPAGRRLLRAKVRQDQDGIWYLQAGVFGPALKVTDHYIVLSWSPQALRDALVFIEGQKAAAQQ